MIEPNETLGSDITEPAPGVRVTLQPVVVSGSSVRLTTQVAISEGAVPGEYRSTYLLRYLLIKETRLLAQGVTNCDIPFAID